MDFNLTDENRMMVKAAKDFCNRVIAQIADDIVKNNDYPFDLIKKFAEAGMLGFTIPEEYGGVGSTYLNMTLVAEELGKTATACIIPMLMNNSTAGVIYHTGTEEIKRKFLPPLCDGSCYASTAFTEPDTGSDPTGITSTATPDGEDYLINGTKRFITSGNKKGYGVFYVKDETGNLTAFIIDKSSPGYTASKPYELMGLEGTNSVDIVLENVRVPKRNILGEKGKGFKILLRWIAGERVQQSAQMVGIGQAALDESLKYSTERIVRGKPMNTMQGFQWMLGEMKVTVDACRYLTYKAACMQDEGKPIEAVSAELKVFVTPAIQEVARMALQIHGAYGYTKEYKVERLYRAAAHAGVVGSSTEINRTVAGMALIKS